jgi:uncharacterized membrane protein YecN with MAPEG domain
VSCTDALSAAIFGRLGAALSANVIANRLRTGTGAGDGGEASLAQTIRTDGNFIEQVPLTLILPGFAETAAARPLVVEILGTPLVAFRLSGAYGPNRSPGVSAARRFGGGMSVVLPAAVSSVILLALARIR